MIDTVSSEGFSGFVMKVSFLFFPMRPLHTGASQRGLIFFLRGAEGATPLRVEAGLPGVLTFQI